MVLQKTGGGFWKSDIGVLAELAGAASFVTNDSLGRALPVY
jgi:hypothetical protein